MSQNNVLRSHLWKIWHDPALYSHHLFTADEQENKKF